MSGLLHRLPLALAVLVTCTLMLSAAVLIGRGVQPRLAVMQVGSGNPETLSYTVADVNRGHIAHKTVTVPGRVEVRFDAEGLLVLQRVRIGETAYWTLSEMDAMTGVLMPVMKLTSTPGTHYSLFDFIQHPMPEGTHYSLYTPLSSEVYIASAADPTPLLLATIEPDAPEGVDLVAIRPTMAWSPDWTRLVISTFGSVKITDADGSRPITIDVPNQEFKHPSWSPDGQSITLAAAWPVDTSIWIVDAQTGMTTANVFGRAPYWCGRQIVYTRGAGTGRSGAHLFDPDTGEDTVMLVRDVLDAVRNGQQVSVWPVDPNSCNWFVFSAVPNGEYGLLHRETGTYVPLGTGAREFKVIDGTLMYQARMQARVGQTVEIRRALLDPAVRRYEVVAQFPRLSDVAWLEPGQRGLAIYLGRLALIDLTDERQPQLIALNGPVVQSFYVME